MLLSVLCNTDFIDFNGQSFWNNYTKLYERISQLVQIPNLLWYCMSSGSYLPAPWYHPARIAKALGFVPLLGLGR